MTPTSSAAPNPQSRQESWADKTCVVGGTTVAYTECGEGEGLVLIHGGESDRRQYEGFHDAVRPSVCTVAYDQRDSGDTVSSGSGYTVADLAADCAGLIEALGWGRAHVLGSSYGGMIAQHLALDHPGHVRSLSLVATSPSIHDLSDYRERVAAQPPDRRDAAMLDAFLSPEAQRRQPALVSGMRATLRGRSAEARARRAAAIASHDVRDRLASIAAPTLVIHGMDDPLIPPAVGRRIARAIAGATFIGIPGARHAVGLEQRDEVGRLVGEHIAQHRS